ncbi:SLC13 family permease [Rhodovibrionaceae bacterium A322]
MEELKITVVLALVVVVFAAFVWEKFSPDVVVMGAVGFLLMTGILSAPEVLGVFSNPAPITVGCMFVLSAALERTGVIDAMGQAMTRAAHFSPGVTIGLLMAVVMIASAFINNTPVVVILTPVVIALARQMNSTPSKFLIPLSYAAIFGGMTTLIGTSTNILVDGVVQKSGLAAIGMFEMTLAAGILGAVGIVYMLLIGRHLLPERDTLSSLLSGVVQRKFLTEVLIPHDSPLIGKTLDKAPFAKARTARVIDVLRDEASMRHELDSLVLQSGDRIVFRTSSGEVLGLSDDGSVSFAALEQNPELETISTRSMRSVEGIIGPRSRLVGQRIADQNLRRRYGVYIRAVHRHDENLKGNFETVRLNFGDTLLMEGPAEGLQRLFESQDITNLMEPRSRPYKRHRAPIAVAAVLGVMVLAGLGLYPIAALALTAAAVVTLGGCIEGEEAYKSIEWRIIMLIFGMLALSVAMEKTGAAALVVDHLVQLVSGLGPFVTLSLIYLLTLVTTEMISNNAAALLLTPIAVAVAHQMGVDPRPFAIAVMFAASASFATPIGYQTNTFVYGAAGYRFSDFLKIGLPLDILLWLTASFVIPFFWPF